MKEKILAALVAVNGQYNLPKEYLEKVALTAPTFESEDMISSWVDSQKPMLAVMQSYADSRVSSMKKELDDLKAAKIDPTANDDLDKRLGVFKEEMTNFFKGQIDNLKSENAKLVEKVNGYESASKTASFEETKKRVAKELGLSEMALKFSSGRLTSDMDESKINEVLSECKKEMISMGLNPIEGQHYQRTSADAASAYAKSYLDDKERELNK
jgi:hypothetical protein